MFITFSGCFSSFLFFFISEIKERVRVKMEMAADWTNSTDDVQKRDDGRERTQSDSWGGCCGGGGYNRFINWLGEEKCCQSSRGWRDELAWISTPSVRGDWWGSMPSISSVRERRSTRGALERGVVLWSRAPQPGYYFACTCYRPPSEKFPLRSPPPLYSSPSPSFVSCGLIDMTDAANDFTPGLDSTTFNTFGTAATAHIGKAAWCYYDCNNIILILTSGTTNAIALYTCV